MSQVRRMKRLRFGIRVLMTVGFGLCVSSAQARLLVNETFTHPDGNLVGQTPTPGPGVTWAAHSGAGNKLIQVSSGEVTLDQSSGSGEDVNTGFAAQSATAKTYASFDFRLPSGQTVNPDGNGLYFAHLKNSALLFRARTGVLAPSGAGDFGLAINADSGFLGAGTTWASDLSFDTTYRVVISYDASTGDAELWLDPVNESSTKITELADGVPGALIEAFALRQNNDYTGSQVIDNVCVGNTFDEAHLCRPDGDFNDDGSWDELDINALSGAIVAGSTDLSFDMNGDGAITPEDITDPGNTEGGGAGWLVVGGANNPNVTGGNPFLNGDSNLDGTVDGLDFVTWNSSKFMDIPNWTEGNWNAVNPVDGQDFIIWNTNKFQSASDVAAVPEPTALSLVFLILAVGGFRKRP